MLLCFNTSCHSLLLINQFLSLSLFFSFSVEKANDKKVLYLPPQYQPQPWAHNVCSINYWSTIIHPGLKAEMCSSSLTPPFSLTQLFQHIQSFFLHNGPVIYPSLYLLCFHPGPGHHCHSLGILQLPPHWSLLIHFYPFQTILCTAANAFPRVKHPVYFTKNKVNLFEWSDPHILLQYHQCSLKSGGTGLLLAPRICQLFLY